MESDKFTKLKTNMVEMMMKMWVVPTHQHYRHLVYKNQLSVFINNIVHFRLFPSNLYICYSILNDVISRGESYSLVYLPRQNEYYPSSDIQYSIYNNCLFI